MYFLGVDGGGTKCRARLVSGDGQVLGEGLSDTANVTAGVENSFKAIMASADAAVRSAGLDSGIYPDCSAGFGIAGANIQEHHSALSAMPFPFRKTSLDSDAYAAWLGAHYPDDGAILIVGTGSAGFVKIGERMKTLGGWGFALSDSGSGALMGRSLIRTALLCHEMIRPPSPLTETVMARFDSNPQALVAWSETALPRDYAAFAPMVIAAAQKGDAVGEKILADSLHDVEELLRALSELGARRICLLGGLSEAYTPLLSAQVKSLLVAPRTDAMGGAIIMARLAAEDTDTAGASGI